jgi:acetolactate synthase-1/3 small subunit
VIHTISALVKNVPGVLATTASIFGEAGLNIRSISCGETEDPSISRMVIGVDSENNKVAKATGLLEAIDSVIQVDDLARKEFVDRELVLIKVNVRPENTTQIMQILEVFRAGVVGMGESTVTAELSGDQDRVEGLIKLLAPFGIKSMCRSGRIALKRGDD